jgi:hypothetical protein
MRAMSRWHFGEAHVWAGIFDVAHVDVVRKIKSSFLTHEG